MNVRKVVVPLAILVSALTFVLLYGGLYELALVIGWNEWQAFLFPFSIDAALLVPLVATLDKRVTGWHRWFVWGFVVFISGVSVLGQWLAHPPTPEAPWAPYVAAFPAVSLILVMHVLWIVAQDHLESREAERVVQEAEAILEEVHEEPRETPVTLPDAVRVLEAAKAKDARLTGRDMAERLGLFDETGKAAYQKGYYWLKRAEDALTA